MFRNNIGDELILRIVDLLKAKNLKLREDHQIYICITGDKGMFGPFQAKVIRSLGSNWTKLGFFILDVEKRNDPRNLSLLAIYKGEDSASSLRENCDEVFRQLNELKGAIFD